MLHVKTVLKIISLWRCILLSVMHDWLTVADVMQVDFWLQSLENLIIIDIRDSKNADNVKTFQSLKLSRTAVSAGKLLLKGTEQQVWQLKINWTKNFLEVTQTETYRSTPRSKTHVYDTNNILYVHLCIAVLIKL